MTTPADVLALANTQAGKRYVWGSKPAPDAPNPASFDCSGFTNWVAERCLLPTLGRWGGTWAAKAACVAAGTLIPVDVAIATAGALLGMDYPAEQHIAFSRGDGTTIEARGVAYGVGSWTATGRPWNWGAQLPGLDYHPAPTRRIAPMHSPPWIFEPIVADLACPTGGAWALAASGAVYALGGAPFKPWPNRAADFAGRTAATLELGPDAGHPYTVVATTGEKYSP